MPYASRRQAAFIHAEAARGTPWAKKFVADSHGTHVRQKTVKQRIGKKRGGY